MPFPSAGCAICKSRRVKCGEEKPHCRRCVKSGRACSYVPVPEGPSPSQTASLVIHSENSYASGTLKRPRGPRSNVYALHNLRGTAVRRGLLQDCKSLAVTYYFHEYNRPLELQPSVTRSVADDIYELYHGAQVSPIVDLAFTSMTLAIFAKKHEHYDATVQASICYHKALRSTQQLIESFDLGDVDTYLLLIFFMGRYEDITYRPQSAASRSAPAPLTGSFLHHDGALAILKAWEKSSERRATSVIKHSRRGLIRSHIMQNVPLPDWMRDGSTFGEDGYDLEFDEKMVQLADLRQRMSDIEHQPPATILKPECSAHMRSIYNDAASIDESLKTMTQNFPPAWWCQKYELPDDVAWPGREFYSNKVFAFANTGCAAVWMQICIARMLATSTQARVLNLSDIAVTDQLHYEDLIEKLRILADKLATSLPYSHKRFFLDRPDSEDRIIAAVRRMDKDIQPYACTPTVWPMSIAAGMRLVDESHKAWFKALLAHLGKVLGVGVIESAQEYDWPEL